MQTFTSRLNCLWVICVLLFLTQFRVTVACPTCGCGVMGKHEPKTLYQAAVLGDVPALNKFLSRISSINKLSNVKLAPLHGAVLSGNIEVVQILLDHEAEINVLSKDNRTPLHIACNQGYYEIARLLIQNGADIHAVDLQGYTPLQAAATLHRHPIFAQSSFGESSSQAGPARDRGTAVEILLSHGANPQSQNKEGATPLHSACQYGYLDVVKLLLDQQVDTNACDNNQCTPLHYAAQKGQQHIAQLLLDAGAIITATDNIGRTAVHTALQAGETDTAAFLLEKGAEADLICYIALGDEKKTQSLLQKQPELVNQYFGGWNALHAAAHTGKSHLVALLLENGANPNQQTKTAGQELPLHFAIAQSHEEVARQLLKSNVNVNAQNQDGQTPLMIAAENCSKPMVELLLASNADLSLQTPQGSTALTLASNQLGNQEVVDLLTHTARKSQSLKLLTSAAIIIALLAIPYFWVRRKAKVS